MKIFKNIILVIIFISFSFFGINFVNAKIPENCKIKSGPSEELNEYLKNTRKIISNINSNLNKKNTNSLNKSKSEALRLWNSITSWNNYYIEWDFKVREPIFNNIPKPIFRDNKLLTNEIEKLNKLLSSYAKKGYLDINIDKNKVCNQIENCNISENTGKALTQIIESTKNIRLLIQKAATDNKNIKECDDVIGITKQKCELIFKTYLDSKQECVDDSKKESILKIGLNFKDTEDGIEKWEKAWNLLTGNGASEEYLNLEKELLKKELSRQGLSGHQAQQILDNLDEYNQNKGFTLNNNPISNIVKTVTKAVDKNQLEELGKLKNKITKLFEGGKKEISIKEISQKLKETKKEVISNYDINTIYNQMLPLAQMQDLDTNQIVREIMIMNMEISQANNLLEKTIPLSQKTCNSQDQGNGKCQY